MTPTEQKETTSPNTTHSTVRPQYSVASHEQGVIVAIELPGVEKQSISITNEKNQLTVNAARTTNTPEGWSLINEVERPSSYQLILNIHRDLDLNKTSARVENGILSISIARREESLPRQIEIND